LHGLVKVHDIVLAVVPDANEHSIYVSANSSTTHPA
jgi:hypothetical protein